MKDLRESRFETVPEFARAAKMSTRHVYKIEAGESSPTIEMLADMLIACDTDLARFFASMTTQASDKDRALYELFERAMLVTAKRDAVASLLRALFLDESSPAHKG